MIRLENLKLALAGRVILDGAGLSVGPGETVALLGASGSGKSMLLRTAVGLLRPDSGRAFILDQEITGASSSDLRQVRRKIGMLFQGTALFDSMTVAENIGFVLREVAGLEKDETDRKVDELLVRLRLGPIHRQYPAELSGGMKKRVGIARALAHDPPVLFLDDPTAGLDPVTGEVIAELIAEFCTRADRATVVVTNQLPVIQRVSTRVALLADGRVTELGAPAKVFAGGHRSLRSYLEGAEARP